jgi:hypothetical protein
MKYFTPELLAKYRSQDDDVADAADEEWERTIAAYAKRLKKIRSKLPEEVRQFMSEYCLHDAKLILFGMHKDLPLLAVLLQLEGTSSQPGEALALFYKTADGQHVGKPRQSALEWVQCDEFDLDEKQGFFTHSLLLTDGSEIKIPFDALSPRRLAFNPFGQNLDLSRFNITPLTLPEDDKTRELVGA